MDIIHPYWGQDFFGFFIILFSRIFSFITGNLTFQDITIDEMQILVLGFSGITTSLIGSLLVYRRMTMIANSISHTILLGIVITYVISISLFGSHSIHLGLSLTTLFIASLVTSIMTTISTNFFIHILRVQKDASIGLIFTTFLALGIIFVTIFTKNAHIGTELILGNIELLQKGDIFATFWLMIITSGLICFFYRPFLISTFDSSFGKSLNMPLKFYDQIIMLITSAAVISSFRIIGVALVLALLVLPPMIARLFTHRFYFLIIGGAMVNLVIAIISVALTRSFLSIYQIPFSTSGMMVSLLFLTYLIAAFLMGQKKYFKKKSISFGYPVYIGNKKGDE
jgi:manganese/zinc/iron transport system permease protein